MYYLKTKNDVNIINIDKLTFALKTRIEYFNEVKNQFEELNKKILQIDKLNERPDLDFIEFLCAEMVPYKFGKTELKKADLKEIKTHFKYNYWVYVYDEKIGLLQWETFGNSRNFGRFNLLNESLYCSDWLLYKQALKDLELTISHISKLDIAFDTSTDPTKQYLKIVKNQSNEIVLNGVKIKDKNKLLYSPYFLCYGTLNEPLKCPQLHFNTKDKSTIIRCYNKTNEIEKQSKKSYIKEKYLNTDKDVYRCEISLNTHATNRLIDDIMITNNLDTEDEALNILLSRLQDKNYLLELHKNAMFRLFRYSTKGQSRKTILTY